MSQLLCMHCLKAFRTQTGLAWHLEHLHQDIEQNHIKEILKDAIGSLSAENSVLNLDCRSEETEATEDFDALAEQDAKFEQTSDSLDNISSQIAAIKSTTIQSLVKVKA